MAASVLIGALLFLWTRMRAACAKIHDHVNKLHQLILLKLLLLMTSSKINEKFFSKKIKEKS
jgi:hypothetical protein